MNPLVSIIFMLTGAIVAVSAAGRAFIEQRLGKMLFYYSLSQAGLIAIGIATANPVGIGGAILHIVNSAVCIGCLSLASWNIKSKTGYSEFEKLGGLAGKMPVTFAAFLIASLSISAIPPLNGFFSVRMIYQGLLGDFVGRTARFSVFLSLITAMFANFITLAASIKSTGAIFLKQPQQNLSKQGITDGNWFFRIAILTLSLLCVAFGIFADLPLEYFVYPLVGSISIGGNYAPLLLMRLFVLGAAIGFIFYYFSGARNEIS